MLESALEQQGQACVSDYVQSTAIGPKRILLERAIAAYEALKTLRPYDPAIETRRLFCSGRLDIAANLFEQATTTLRADILRDPNFACAHNALGVAYGRLGKAKEAHASFDKAAELTPEWALPPFQIANILITAGKIKEAIPYLEKAVSFNPYSCSKGEGLRYGFPQPSPWRIVEIESLPLPASSGSVVEDRHPAATNKSTRH